MRFNELMNEPNFDINQSEAELKESFESRFNELMNEPNFDINQSEAELKESFESRFNELMNEPNFDINQSEAELKEQFETRFNELLEENDFDTEDMIEESFDHVDMMTAIDEALEHFNTLSTTDDADNLMEIPSQEGNIDELLAALPSILAEIEGLNAEKSGSTTLTAVLTSAGALLAIGAGFVIRNKFTAVSKKDELESLL